ncbi:hypothetical protein [Legionella taurinensis]|uniref:hypothetical protein n=1 Tax=Legionella taurinensis TaxID=70611 RepID=UPI001F5F2906|nr:hypothetical protein [Legionella taurinensis]MDX1838793.1 hypothetical protein [Legionella taurinensis]
MMDKKRYYRAAIRWLPQGRENPPLIQYLLLDAKLEYLIFPKQLQVSHIQQTLVAILDEMQSLCPATHPLKVHFKSINVHYGGHRQDSARFHSLIRRLLTRRGLLAPDSRMAYLLKKDELKRFKQALYWLDIDTRTRGCAFVAHLWAIALKATRSRVELAIRQLWKARYGIQRMSNHDKERFAEFYAHL